MLHSGTVHTRSRSSVGKRNFSVFHDYHYTTYRTVVYCISAPAKDTKPAKMGNKCRASVSRGARAAWVSVRAEEVAADGVGDPDRGGFLGITWYSSGMCAGIFVLSCVLS